MKSPAISFEQTRRTRHRVAAHAWPLACGALLLATGCASYRDTSRDHELPEFRPPDLTLAAMKSVPTRILCRPA